MQTALTIAGSDSGGGAGIQADLRTFQAHGVFGTSAVTAITAQNTRGVRAVAPVAPDIVAAQIDAVAEDLPPAATKIGMLANAAIVRAVSAAIDRHALPHVVVDPVMIAKGGDALLDPDAVYALVELILPRAAVLTPNIPEAERLTSMRIVTTADMRRAAELLRARGPRAVVVKGGHLDGPAVDVVATRDGIDELTAPRLASRHTHGTGCTFSAAIAAQLALGRSVPDAIARAKRYVHAAIERAPGLGAGHGPLGIGDT